MTTVLFPMGAASGAVSIAVDTLTSLAPQVVECIQQDRAADLEGLLAQNGIPAELRGDAVRQFAIGFSLFQAFDASLRTEPLSIDSVECMADHMTRENILQEGFSLTLGDFSNLQMVNFEALRSLGNSLERQIARARRIKEIHGYIGDVVKTATALAKIGMRQRSQQIFNGAIDVARLDLIRQPERLFEELTDIAQALEKAGHRRMAQDLIGQVLEDIARHVSSVSELNILQMAYRLSDLQAVLHRLSGDREPTGRNAELLQKLAGVVAMIRAGDFRIDYLRGFNQLFPDESPSRGGEPEAAFDAAFRKIVERPDAAGDELFQMFQELVNACIARAEREGVHEGFDRTLELILDRLNDDRRAPNLLSHLAKRVLDLEDTRR
jgi:hypothetical protein